MTRRVETRCRAKFQRPGKSPRSPSIVAAARFGSFIARHDGVLIGDYAISRAPGTRSNARTIVLEVDGERLRAHNLARHRSTKALLASLRAEGLNVSCARNASAAFRVKLLTAIVTAAPSSNSARVTRPQGEIKGEAAAAVWLLTLLARGGSHEQPQRGRRAP